jgi:hypothetical protein
MAGPHEDDEALRRSLLIKDGMSPDEATIFAKVQLDWTPYGFVNLFPNTNGTKIFWLSVVLAVFIVIGKALSYFAANAG